MTTDLSWRSGARFAWRTVALAGAGVGAAIVGVIAVAYLLATGDDTFLIPTFGGPIFSFIGSLILHRRPGHGIGRLMLVIGVALSATLAATLILQTIDPFGFRLGPIVEIVGVATSATVNLAILAGSLVLIVWFPDGHRTSRLGLLVEAMVVAYAFFAIIIGSFVGEIDERINAAVFMTLIAMYVVAFVDLLRRYRRSDRVRQAQIRWVLAGAGMTCVFIALMLAFGDQYDFLWGVWIMSTMLPAVAIGIAITRYHLYDIDRIISRSVSYGLVTVLLFGLFWVVNLTLVQAVTPVTGGGAFAVAGSTLVVAALFHPLRKRVQAIVDRRFHRSRYDAERLVAGLSGHLRDELDLVAVRSAIVATVDGSVEPRSVDLWLRDGGSVG